MIHVLNALLVIVLVMNLFTLGTSRILSVIRIVGTQGAVIGIIPLLMHEHLTIPSVVASAAAIILKSIVIPNIMVKALRDAEIKREIEPLIGFLPSILLGAAATAVSLLISNRMAMTEAHAATLIIATAIATVFIGFIILTTRVKALSQVLGYLMLENGIYIFSLLLVEAIPLVVEMGMLLDLFVSIFVISIITNHINQAFASMDTRNLSSLKE
ncbi:MAG: hypothetical protein WCT14_03885 [Treponemataceae bacterium]